MLETWLPWPQTRGSPMDCPAGASLACSSSAIHIYYFLFTQFSPSNKDLKPQSPFFNNVPTGNRAPLKLAWFSQFYEGLVCLHHGLCCPAALIAILPEPAASFAASLFNQSPLASMLVREPLALSSKAALPSSKHAGPESVCYCQFWCLVAPVVCLHIIPCSSFLVPSASLWLP